MNSNFHFCPNCRSSDFEFPNNRRFVCKDCQYEYYQNIAAAVGGFLKFNNKYLFLKRAKNPKIHHLDVAGGFVDPNECAEEALSREIKEELGIEIATNHWNYLRSFANDYHYKYVDYKTLDFFFAYEFNQKPEFVLDKEENSDYIWLDLHELNSDEIAFDSVRNVVDWLKNT